MASLKQWMSATAASIASHVGTLLGSGVHGMSGWGGSPSALGGSASAGTATTVARGDHVHPTTGVMTTDHVANAISGFNAAPVALGASAAAGNASTISRSNHVHPLPSAADVGALPLGGGTLTGPLAAPGYRSRAGEAGAYGEAWANVNLEYRAWQAVHLWLGSYDFGAIRTTVHLAGGTPAALGTASAGTAETLSRSDHVHPMPSAANVGAMSTSHAANAITALGGTSQALGTVSNGSGTAVALSNHVHPMPSAANVGALALTGGTLTDTLNCRTILPTVDSSYTLGGTGTRFYRGWFDELYTGYLESGNIIPVGDDTYNLGSSGKRWNDIWATNNVIQTSDERHKKDIADSDLGLAFILGLRPVRYLHVIGGRDVIASDMPGGDPVTVARPGVRPHYGFLAGQVKALIGSADFGGYVESEEGEMGLRYAEFIAPLCKAVQELAARLDALEARR